VFLKTVLEGCVATAKARGVTVITPAFIQEIRDKRAKDRPPSLLARIEEFLHRMRHDG
jgi:hypothetical protein